MHAGRNRHIRPPSHSVPAPVQSEYGDLYKVTLQTSGDAVTELRVKYFDTIPPCTSICVLKTGFLFAASEFGNHALYQFLVGLWICCIRGSRAAMWDVLRAGSPCRKGHRR